MQSQSTQLRLFSQISQIHCLKFIKNAIANLVFLRKKGDILVPLCALSQWSALTWETKEISYVNIIYIHIWHRRAVLLLIIKNSNGIFHISRVEPPKIAWLAVHQIFRCKWILKVIIAAFYDSISHISHILDIPTQ